ncbi:MAG: hypothetical protein DHS20C09_15600 [marine bacterium B5-7]|nr:MAG: hypothetical protein DHS20C09_15600 [marine bacterium B5-7]
MDIDSIGVCMENGFFDNLSNNVLKIDNCEVYSSTADGSGLSCVSCADGFYSLYDTSSNVYGSKCVTKE